MELDFGNIIFRGLNTNSTDKFLIILESEFNKLALLTIEHLFFDIKIQAKLIILVQDVDHIFKEGLGVFEQDGYHFLVFFQGAWWLTVEHLGAERYDDGVFLWIDQKADVFGFDDVDEENAGKGLLGL